MKAQLFKNRESLFNHYVQSHPRGTVLQTTQWGKLKETSGWAYYPLAVEEKGLIRASALMLAKKAPWGGPCFFYSPRGPLFSSEQALQTLLTAARQLARQEKALLWKMDPAIPLPNKEWAQFAAQNHLRQVAAGVDFGGIQPRFVMLLDLQGSLEELLGKMKSKTRYNIRYAARKGVRVFPSEDAQQLQIFYTLLLETARRDHFSIRPFAYFQALWQHLVGQKMAQLFLAYHGETPLAGAICFYLGTKAWYVYGASTSEKRNLQASHLLQWEMIKWAKGRGAGQYDFRGVSGDLSPTNPLYGLYRFKEGFGAQLREYVGEYDLPLSGGGYALWKGGLAVHNWLRQKKKPLA